MKFARQIILVINLYMTIDIATANGKKYDLLEMEKTDEGNYIKLEGINRDKEFYKLIHVIKLNKDNNEVSLGRGHDSDIKISDISVSRIHAMISITPKGYVLKDNESKFGSLMLLPSKYEILPEKNQFLQIGRTTLGLMIKPNEIEKVLPKVTSVVTKEASSM